MVTDRLPPGTKRAVDGRVFREVMQTREDGSKFKQLRQVASTLEEAKMYYRDFYHPTLGWILDGYKLARDHPLPLPEGALVEGSIQFESDEPSSTEEDSSTYSRKGN